MLEDKLRETDWEVTQETLEEQVAVMRTAEFRERLLGTPNPVTGMALFDEVLYSYDKMFSLGEPANYEPDPEDSIGARARRAGVTPRCQVQPSSETRQVPPVP